MARRYTPSQVKKYVEVVGGILGLGDWSLSIVFVDRDDLEVDDCSAHIQVYQAAGNLAKVTFSNDVLGFAREELRSIVVHELTHCILARFANYLDAVIDVGFNHAASDHRQLMKDQAVEREEEVVYHIERSLGRLVPLPPTPQGKA